jgi:hypothetical protein
LGARVAFNPYSTDGRDLLTNSGSIQVPIMITVDRKTLTPRMFERLIEAVEQASLQTDLDLLRETYEEFPKFARTEGESFRNLHIQRNRFAITSISRGSILIGGSVLLGIAWAIKQFVQPGWERSDTKNEWDEWVARIIDKSSEALLKNISAFTERLQRLRITRVSISEQSEDNLLTEEKRHQIEYRSRKKENPHG